MTRVTLFIGSHRSQDRAERVEVANAKIEKMRVYTALVAGATAAVMDAFPELQRMTDYTLLPAYVAAPGFDAYKTALKVRCALARPLCVCTSHHHRRTIAVAGHS